MTLAVVWSTTRLRLAATALSLSVVVEFSQLLDWPWLVSVRSARLGALLGHGLQWPGLLAYALGAALS